MGLKRVLTLFAASTVLIGGSAVAGDEQKKPAFVSERATAFGVTPALTSLPPELLVTPPDQEPPLVINRTNERRVKFVKPGAGAADKPFQDPLVGRISNRPAAMPTPTITWDGMVAAGSAPPDTNIDVGPNHVVELVNATRMQVWDKAGTSLFGPVSIRTLFSSLPSGNACRAGDDDGDPIVLYDPLADRWLISHFEVDAFPNYQCIAISQTGDPTGAYYAYAFQMPQPPTIPEHKFQDYPHYGVWPDAYYLTTNQFNQALTAWRGAGNFAFDRTKMIAGDATASYIYFDYYGVDPNAGGMLPTDVDGYVPPPTGLPQIFMEFRADEFGDPADTLRPYEFVPNFASPASSTFTVRPDIPVAAFDARQPSGRTDIEQMGGENLDSIADRLLFRLAYRNLGTVATAANSWVGNFTVNVSGVDPSASAANYQAGIRWFELHSTGTGLPTLYDEGTHNLAPGNGGSGLNNWMGSIAQDGVGNIALGFSQAGTGQRADIKIAGRSGAAAAGTLNEGEAVLYAAAGSQTATSSRWGDYSSMSVDPLDECAFWYAQEYYATTASFAWRTRIGRFVFPGCTPAPKGTLDVTVTNCSGGAPIQGAIVTVTGGFTRISNASGLASFTTAPGTFTVSATRPGYSTGTTGATVVDGSTTVVGLCITGVPVMSAGTSGLTSETCSAPNSAIDPGESVAVSLCVQNTGGADTVALVGTLQATGGVTSPGPGQSYGVVTAGGAAVCANHDFVASAGLTCGAGLTASLQLQDGASNLGTVTYNFVTGGTASSTPINENFDGVTAPALPAGWTETSSGGVAPWATTTTAGYFVSPPNGAGCGSIANVAEAILASPTAAAAAGAAQLTFQNNRNFESGYDGGVLEISVDGGAFADVITAGGSWVAGGYNGTISTAYGNPLAGRAAWTGNSSGFATTTVNLPASVAGHNVALRWRAGFDSSVSPAGAGWRIDNVVLTSSRPVCAVTCAAPSDLIFKDGLQQ